MKKILIFLCNLLLAGVVYAQSDSTKTVNHYFSVQANQLLRQLINFGGSSQGVANPFLLNYSMTGKDSNFGVSVGLGYRANSFATTSEFEERETDVQELHLRIGALKNWFLSERWLMGLGVDFLREDFYNETDTEFKTSSGSGEEIETTNTTKGWGLGPRLTLSYKLNKRIMIGTEASYYYKKAEVISEISRSGSDNDEKSEGTNSGLSFEVPTVLYLTITL